VPCCVSLYDSYLCGTGFLSICVISYLYVFLLLFCFYILCILYILLDVVAWVEADGGLLFNSAFKNSILRRGPSIGFTRLPKGFMARKRLNIPSVKSCSELYSGMSILFRLHA
jgi:hypothetical protein